MELGSRFLLWHPFLCVHISAWPLRIASGGVSVALLVSPYASLLEWRFDPLSHSSTSSERPEWSSVAVLTRKMCRREGSDERLFFCECARCLPWNPHLVRWIAGVHDLTPPSGRTRTGGVGMNRPMRLVGLDHVPPKGGGADVGGEPSRLANNGRAVDT